MTVPYDELQHFSWRGIVVPISARSATHSHEIVAHHLHYRQGELIEIPGSRNLRFRYTIPMRDGFFKGPYAAQLFSQVLPTFLAAYFDRSPGDLVDPILGAKRCKPVSLQDNSDVDKRDGEDLDVEFVEAPAQDDLESEQFDPSPAGLSEQGQEIDRQMAALDWAGDPPEQISGEEQDWETETPPDASVNPIDAITGALRQGQRANQKTKAIFQDTYSRLRALEDATDDVGITTRAPLIRRSRDLRLSVARAQREQQSRGRPRKVTRLHQDMTVVEAAAYVGLTVQELIELNHSFAKLTVIPQGTLVTHYKNEVAA